MERLSKLFGGFAQTSRESSKIFLTNGRAMALIASFTSLLYSILFITKFLSLHPLQVELAINSSLLRTTHPSSREFPKLVLEIMKELGIFIGLELVFIFVFSAASAFSSAATIFTSSVSLRDKNLSNRNLALSTTRLWKRPLVTSFYLFIFRVGYAFLLLAILLPFLLTRTAFSVISKVIYIVAVLFCAYLGVTWMLGIVVSVLEEKYGIEALGQAARLAKGIKVRGFCLITFIILLSYGQLLIMMLLLFKRSYMTQLLVGLVLENAIWLVKMYVLMAFTVLYHESKAIHGEEIESEMSFEYTKIPSLLPIVREDLKE